MPLRGAIVSAAISLAIGGAAGFYGYKKSLTEKQLRYKKKMERVKEIEEEMLDEAKKKAEVILEQAEVKAQKIEDQRLAKMEEIQHRHSLSEEKMKLSEIAGIKPEEAKQQIMERIEAEHQEELIRYIEKFKTIKAEEASKEAAIIISQALPKVAADTVSEFTSKMIDLPSEEFKGKLI